MVIKTESGYTLKVIFTEQFLAKVAIFRCFDVCSVRPPQIFQVQAKVSTVRLVFPDYLSVSYDYAAVENEISKGSNLVKKTPKFNTKINEIEKKKLSIMIMINILLLQNLTSSKNDIAALVKKIDFDDKLKKIE